MRRQKPRAAYSLVELMVTIAIAAIVAAIAVTAMTGVSQGTAQATAQRNLNLLNGAVNAFKNARWEIVLSPGEGISDEEAVFYSLQYIDDNAPPPNTPSLAREISFVSTSDSTKYRGIWNGRYFQILSPGADGEGIDLGSLGGSIGPGPPEGFTPVPPQ